MSADLEAQIQFATEFALFLVATAGLALSLLRYELLTRSQLTRLALTVAFAALAGASFVHGSLIIDDLGDPVILVARSIGWVALLVGVVRWAGGPVSRQLVIVSFVLGVSGVVAATMDAELFAAGCRAVAAGGVGTALLLASRRAIAARVAASSAATLLLVVLVLSVGLGAVLSNTIEDQAISSVDTRALREASLIERSRNDAIRAAGLTSKGLAGASEFAPLVVAINDAGAATPEQSQQLNLVVTGLGSALQDEPIALAYVDTRAGVVAASNLPAASFARLLRTPAAEDAIVNNRSTGDVVALGDRAIALGMVPVRAGVEGGRRLLGLVVAAVEVDDDYLSARAGAEDAITLAIWGPNGVVASTGPQPPADTAARLAKKVLGGADGSTATTSDRFIAARAVRSQTNEPLFALIVSRSTATVDEGRERLFRTFFVIAFGGTLLALLLAAIVGDRIGAGVRRLTSSAEALERGETGVRSGVRNDDEVGRLGAAFDSMAQSIEEKTDALRQAALDEARLRNRLEAVVAGMGEALVAIDEGGVVSDFNEAAEDLFGISGDDAKGQRVDALIRVTNEEGLDMNDRLTTGDGERWSELVDVDLAGTLVPVALTSGPLRAPDGEVTGRVLVFRDLRAEREVERMKREFLSRVGHELRTPLTPLLGYARILAGREVPSDRAREISRAMVASGERMERIVEMLEFFASAQAGRTVLRPQELDVRDVLTPVVDARQATAPDGVVISRRVRSGTPKIIGDPYWLQRTVDELLDNAIKFSPSGGRIAVSAGPSDTGGVEISVRDTGLGMTDDELERAFAEWSQGDESDTRAYGGLGLGLALVQRVVERHGGHVTCETAPGKGSKFSILLPAASD
ncbi:MAG TPA: ATP-binding protein [Acidimicrobiales bacterium]|nr:ATP-binding protein [Acidimicrobiales bacterium]